MISRGENSIREWRGLRGKLWKRMTGKAETPCPPPPGTDREGPARFPSGADTSPQVGSPAGNGWSVGRRAPSERGCQSFTS